MERASVLQPLLDLFDQPAYLEIGVDHGETFRALKAARKTGVDPHFGFDVPAAQAAQPNARFHRMTSDAFFATEADGDLFDLVFIDGLHTFDQTFRDLLNSLAVTHAQSIIVIDDVLPSSAVAAIPDPHLVTRLRNALEDPDSTWMGDVYKLVYLIESFLPMFQYATVLENHGQTILWRDARRLPESPRTVEAISRLTYIDTVLDRAPYRMRPFAEILAAIKARRS